MPALTSGKYRVGLALKNGQYLKIAVDNGRIVGGVITYPDGVIHRLTGATSVKFLADILKENIPSLSTTPRIPQQKTVYHPSLGRTVATPVRNKGSLIGAASVETVMDDYYGGLKTNTIESVSPQEIVQNLYVLLTLNRNY